jgi:hypothetical protein
MRFLQMKKQLEGFDEIQSEFIFESEDEVDDIGNEKNNLYEILLKRMEEWNLKKR